MRKLVPQQYLRVRQQAHTPCQGLPTNQTILRLLWKRFRLIPSPMSKVKKSPVKVEMHKRKKQLVHLIDIQVAVSTPLLLGPQAQGLLHPTGVHPLLQSKNAGRQKPPESTVLQWKLN